MFRGRLETEPQTRNEDLFLYYKNPEPTGSGTIL